MTTKTEEDMDVFKFLDIEDYKGRIFDSNSHGETFHLLDYAYFAECFKECPFLFRPLFIMCVEHAEKHWTRPESVFQHMPRMFMEMLPKPDSPNDQPRSHR